MARVSRLQAGAPVAGSSWPLGGVVIFAALLALAGVVVSASILSGEAPRATPAAAAAEVALDAFKVRDGPRDSTLEVEAAVTLLNRTDRAIAYAAGDFALPTMASEAPLEVQRATLGAGDLPPGGGSARD